MSITIAKANLAVFTLLILGLSSQVYALQNCSNLLQDHINWANKADIKPVYPKKGESYHVGLTKTTNSNNRKFASYTEALIDLPIPGNPADELVGTGNIWFSDRRAVNDQPFSGRTDQQKITLRKHVDPSKMIVNIELLSWGNAQENFLAQCDNGHIYAFKSDHHGTHLIDITLSKEKKETSEVCVDFESPLMVGTKYGMPSGHKSGDLAFTLANGIPVTLWNFSYGGGRNFNQVQIDPVTRFGSGRQNIGINNINVEFDFSRLGFQVLQVQFQYLDLGGIENVAVNGGPIFVGELSATPNPINGISFNVVENRLPSGKTGTVTLNGPVNKLRIGGQELWIDNVCVRH